VEAKTLGRLDRKHYWVALVGLLVLKYVLAHYAGVSSIWLELAAMLVLATRGNDFGLSTGVTVLLWLVFCLGLPVGSVLLEMPDAVIGLFGLLALLLYCVGGLIPGDSNANQYGAPGQGFSAFNTNRQAVAPSTSFATHRAAASSVVPAQRIASFGARR
jgi:uncharacterized membrane protein YhaH (DUF805 family)